ncbi:MAG: C40 family peptidase [Cryomorphaceae bacterium]|nr:C40 family peptidase [Cryomorphaceae bacterium]
MAISLLFWACGGMKSSTTSYPEFEWDTNDGPLVIDDRKVENTAESKKEEAPTAEVTSDLESVVKDWVGTPYRWGGTSKSGADCSGFTLKVYEEVYGQTLPGRRAEDFFQSAKVINEKQAQPGDLVFFRIKGRRIDHVGVYLGNRRFAHASSSKGVVISSLDESYYAKHFFKFGRIEL